MLMLMRPKMATSRNSGTRVSLLKRLVSMNVRRTMPIMVATMMIRSRRRLLISAVTIACCLSVFWSINALRRSPGQPGRRGPLQANTFNSGNCKGQLKGATGERQRA